MSIDALFCVCMDPWDEPKGGQARFAQQMLHAFGERLAVAGVTRERLPLRKWIDRPFNGKTIKFFNMGRIRQSDFKKPLIPLRLIVYIYARIAMPKLYSSCVRNIFIESPEVLFAASKYKWNSLCYCFSGVSNPVENSRYKWARAFGSIFEMKLFSDLNISNAETILAAADNKAINEMVLRSKGKIGKGIVHHFPTRVDIENIKRASKSDSRGSLHLDNDKKIIVSCGRLSWVKGWCFLLDSLSHLIAYDNRWLLIFVGDGEDRSKIQMRARALNIENNIIITGFVPNNMVYSYLYAADVCAVASFKEGWSLAMLEMLACGKVLVSTDVSGADEMIRSGENGFIVKERDPVLFANALIRALELEKSEKVSLEIASRYSLKTLATDLGTLWSPVS